MSKKKSFSSSFIIKKVFNIGSPDAETDDLLLDVFVHTDGLNQIYDTKSQKSVLIGRTGSGKSAIIKFLKSSCANCKEISPETMSLKFLSNSTILQHFKQLNVNLNFFYKVLWKHVFMVELLKLYFKEDEKYYLNNNTFFQNIIDNIRKKASKKNPQQQRAVKYLENWTNDFWEETEYRIKSFEDKIRDNYTSQMGVSIEAISSKLSGSVDVEQSFFYEAKSKAENVIHKSQSTELIEIFSIMKEEMFNNHQKKFFIIIDDLDKEWVEDEFRYELIGAMIEVIKEFRQFHGVKIIIALRENLSDLVFSGLKNKGGQRDKLKPLFAYLDWTSDELKEFLDKRLKILSDDQLDVNNAFHSIRRDNKTGIDYVIDRSYKRPRDIIAYINFAIEESNNKSSFTRDILFKVETKYSLHRFHSLEDEWNENYGDFKELTGFLRGIHNGFRLKSINENSFEDVYFSNNIDIVYKGELKRAVDEWINERIKFIVFLKRIILIFFRIGILGIKKGPNYPTVFYYDHDVLIDRNDISTNSRFYVHPSLYSFFKVNVLEQLPEQTD